MGNRPLAALALLIVGASSPQGRQGIGEPEPSRQLLTRSVGNVGSQPRSVGIAFQAVMLGSGVPGGEVIIEGCPEQSERMVRLRGTTLQEVLENMAGADPRYRWEVKNGAVDLLPEKGVPLLLKVRVGAFDSKDATDIASAGTLLFGLPEIRTGATALGITRNSTGTGPYALVPGRRPARKPLGVRLRDVTVLHALNAIVLANKHGVWIYREIRCGPTQFFDVEFSE